MDSNNRAPGKENTGGNGSLPKSQSSGSIGNNGGSGSISLRKGMSNGPRGSTGGASNTNNHNGGTQPNSSNGNGTAQHRVTSLEETPRYVRRNYIAKGSHKVVYHAFDEEEGIEVAWNEIDTTSISELGKVQREIQLLQSLNHPAVIKCHNSWLDEERRALVFITELMTSGTLTDFISQQTSQSLKPHVMAKYSRQILNGLAYLASQDVIHRDLKANNIFINGHKGEVKIGDLGLSIASRAANSVLGTPEYMAPEIYEEDYTNAVDIWSFGMCMLQMVSGVHPYRECSNVAQIFKKVTNGILPEASDAVTDPMVKDVIFSCLNLDAEKRPTAAQLLNHEFFKEKDVDLVEGVEGGSVQETSSNVEANAPTPRNTTEVSKESSVSNDRGIAAASVDDTSPQSILAWIRAGPTALQPAFAQFALEKRWIDARCHSEWRDSSLFVSSTSSLQLPPQSLNSLSASNSPTLQPRTVQYQPNLSSPSSPTQCENSISNNSAERRRVEIVSALHSRRMTDVSSMDSIFSLGSTATPQQQQYQQQELQQHISTTPTTMAAASTATAAASTASIPRPMSTTSMNSQGTPQQVGFEQDKADKKKAAELTTQKLLAQMMMGSSGTTSSSAKATTSPPAPDPQN